jgi:ketosteroid isomerase-like protein
MTDRSTAEAEPPEVVRRYQDAHDRRDTETALRTFADDATVHDDGQDYQGHDEIRAWLSTASTKWTYTRTLVSAQAVDANTWLVVNHLEGDFPGGVVDLRYRFELSSDRICSLSIVP